MKKWKPNSIRWERADREGEAFAWHVLQLADLPHESIRLSQEILKMDPAWESAYRTQMQAYLKLGNRPQALRTYEQCRRILETEFGVPPLPETQALHTRIKSIGME